MTSPDDKDERLKTPPGSRARTTPYSTPADSEVTSEFNLAEATLAALRNRYELLEELGRGGMGAVYKARDRETGDVVAVKVLLPEIAARSDILERFKSELLLARKITHKNVCRVHDLNRFGPVAAISMEYIEGESLRALLNRVDGLSIHHGLRILSQALAGLAEAHAQGVVHRDLKPENILIARDGTVKVMDFGIARSLDSGQTATGLLIGTPRYMSPEQAEGKPADARSDLYSLGLIMYEMFTGQHPFRADTPVGFALQQVHETPAPARRLEPDLPERVVRAIEKCVEKDPKKRFQSVAELEAALSEQIEARPAAVDEELAIPARQATWRRWDWALLVLAGLAVFTFIQWRDNVFPAGKMKLEVDAISARREAEAVASRLDNPFPTRAQARLEYRPDEYVARFVARFYAGVVHRKGSLKEAIEVELPLYWRLRFTSPDWTAVQSDHLLAAYGGIPDRYAIVNRKGKVEEFSNPILTAALLRDYQPASLEQRRAIARGAAETVCGPLPANLMFVETAGGEWNAAYAATWKPIHPPAQPPWAEVSLWTDRVTRVKCSPYVVASPADLKQVSIQMRVLPAIAVLPFFFFLAWPLLYFGIAQCHHSPVLWKRLPLAVILGLSGSWVLAPIAIGSSAPSLLFLGGGALALSALAWAALVGNEHLLQRRVPDVIASYVLALRGRVLEPAVGLAVVRGALAGMILVGAEILLARWMPAFLDPSPVGYAAASFSPALFVVASAIFNSFVLGLVYLAVFLGDFYKEILAVRRKTRAKLAEAGMWLLWVVVAALTLAFGIVILRANLGLTLSTGPEVLGVPFALGLLVALLLPAYGVLTAIVALATALLWTTNYPLLGMLAEVGNGAHWGVFIGWGTVVAAATVVAFRSQIVHALQRQRAEFQ